MLRQDKIAVAFALDARNHWLHNPNAYIKYGKFLRYYSADSRDLLYFSILHVCSFVALS